MKTREVSQPCFNQTKLEKNQHDQVTSGMKLESKTNHQKSSYKFKDHDDEFDAIRSTN